MLLPVCECPFVEEREVNYVSVFFAIMNQNWAEAHYDIVNWVKNNCFLSSCYVHFMGPLSFS